MKILIIKTVPGEIRVRKMTYNIQEIGLALALRRKGHEADVMCCSDENQYREHNLVIDGQQLKMYCVKALKILKNGFPMLVDSILEYYDILQVSEYNQLYNWYLSKKYHHKLVCYHGPYFSEFNHNYNLMAKIFDMFFVQRYRKLGTQFITKSELAADYLKLKDLKNVRAIGVGLNVTFLVSSCNEIFPNIDCITNLNCLKLVYIGVIEPRRNSIFLLSILKRLVMDGVDFKLILIGKYRDDVYKKIFEQTIKEYKLEKYILYIPPMEQKYLSHIYMNTDIFLLPTIYDIYGMVLLEAMYFGIPTITTVNGGSNMMIKNAENGFVVDDFNVDTWVCLIKKMAKDKNSCKKIGIAAHQTIVNHFTWDKLSDQFIEEYERKIREYE